MFDPSDPVPDSIPVPADFWKRYLPGRNLPKLDFAPEMKRMQVWVFARDGYEVVGCVDLVYDWTVEVVILAKNETVSQDFGKIATFVETRRHAVMICDRGSDPLPPEQVFPWLAKPTGSDAVIKVLGKIVEPMSIIDFGGAPSMTPAEAEQVDACMGDPRRRVSLDGKHWVDYEAMVDPDPFDSYPWRRSGAEVSFPVTFAPPMCEGGELYGGGKSCTNASSAQGMIAGSLVPLCATCCIVREQKIAGLMRPYNRVAALGMAAKLFDRAHAAMMAERVRACRPTLFGGVFDLRAP